MDKKLKDSSPIYVQIMDKIRQSIIAGELKPGQRILSVRDWALEFGVNPNTVQRSLTELEREGIIQSERTIGKFVTKDMSLIQRERQKEAELAVHQFRERMQALGFTEEETAAFFQTECRDRIG